MNSMYLRFNVSLIVAFHQLARFGEQSQCYVDLAEIAQCFCDGGASPGMRQLIAGRGESTWIATAGSHLIYLSLGCRTDHAVRNQRLGKKRKSILLGKSETFGYYSFRACVVVAHRVVLPDHRETPGECEWISQFAGKLDGFLRFFLGLIGISQNPKCHRVETVTTDARILPELERQRSMLLLIV